MTATCTFRHRPTESDIRHLAAAERPVILQLLTGQNTRITATGAATTQAGPVLALDSAATADGTAIEVELEVAAEFAEAAVRPLNASVANPYRPRRGEPAARLVGQLVGHRERVTTRLEFSDTAKRGPERRRLAVLLASYYGVEFERVVTWRQVYIDTGHEITESGHFRATSERRDVSTHSYGHGRTDARIWGPAAGVAKFAAVLPIVLEEIDRLSLAWGKQVSAWLTGAGEYWCTPGERRTAVRHARARYAESLAYALGSSVVPSGGGEMDPTTPLPHQYASAVLATLREHGWTWLDQWQRPETEATYEGCASLAERIASQLAEQHSQAYSAQRKAEAAARHAAADALAAQRAADLARPHHVLTPEDLAEMDRAPRPQRVEEEFTEQPITARAPRPAVVETAEDLRTQAAILVELGAPAAAQFLLDQADELEQATATDEPTAAPSGQPAPAEAPAPVRQLPQPIHRTAPVPRLIPAGPWQPAFSPPPADRFALTA